MHSHSPERVGGSESPVALACLPRSLITVDVVGQLRPLKSLARSTPSKDTALAKKYIRCSAVYSVGFPAPLPPKLRRAGSSARWSGC